MVSPFKENIPATNSSLTSAEIRDNFSALYDKVKTLEVQSTDSTSLRILGGPVYFRAGSSQQLKLVKFPEISLDLNQAVSYKTEKDGYGQLSRYQQTSRGLSSFQTQGPILEILLSANSSGQVVITESTAAQSNRLSSPFNIYFDDSEIPLALIFVEKNSEGVLQKVVQSDITEARPVMTSAFQNNAQVSDIESSLEDTIERVSILEPATWVSDNLKLRIPPATKLEADLTTLTNTQVEVMSGSIFVNGYDLRFAGGYVDFSIGASPSDPRIFAAGTTAITVGYWARALISLQYDSLSVDPTENSKLIFTHGSAAASADQALKPSVPVGNYPLGYVLYRMNSSNIYPILDQATVGTQRVNYQFSIISLSSVPTSDDAFATFQADLSGNGFTNADVTTIIFPADQYVDISDDNTRPIRRQIYSTTYNTMTGIATVVVKNSFVDISLLRNPKVRSTAKHQIIVESR